MHYASLMDILKPVYDLQHNISYRFQFFLIPHWVQVIVGIVE